MGGVDACRGDIPRGDDCAGKDDDEEGPALEAPINETWKTDSEKERAGVTEYLSQLRIHAACSWVDCALQQAAGSGKQEDGRELRYLQTCRSDDHQPVTV